MPEAIHCLICGTENTPEAEVCTFCGAPLEPGQLPAQPSEDEPDWLHDLRSTDASGQEVGGAGLEGVAGSPEPDASVPDWLSRIRERNKTDGDEPLSLELPGQENDDAPWMAALQNETPAGAPGEDDWLSRLGEDAPLAEDQPVTQPEYGAGSSDAADAAPAEIPEWLRNFSADISADTSADAASTGISDSAAPAAGEENISFGAQDEYNWLDNPAGPAADVSAGAEPSGSESQSQPLGEGDDLSSFLARLEGAQEEDASASARAEGTPAQPSAEEGSLEWAAPEAESDASLSTGAIDFSNLFAASDEAETAQPYQPGEFSEDSLPDWRQYLQEGDTGETPEAGNGPTEPSQPEPAAAEPDWLQDFSASQTPAVAPGEAAGLPDWLNAEPGAGAEIFGAAPESSAHEEEPAATEPAAEVPATQPGEGLEPPLASVEGLAGWFDSLEQPEAAPAEPENAAPETGAGAEPEPTGSETAESEPTPDWLRELGEAPAEPSNAGTPALIGGEEALASPAGEGDQPFAVDLPDWLNEEQAASETGAPASAAESSSAELAHAELPEWVQEMRPIESIIPAQGAAPETDQRVEKAGPLAGMAGILAAEELAARYRKPPVYSMKLRVTEKQRSQSALFDSILAEETQPLQLPRQRKQTGGTLLRVALALVLLVVLAIPLLPGMGISPLVMPALFPRDMQDMFNQIDKSLAPETPVLLAVDYEPGLSGEMSLAASSLVAQLEAKNTRIVVVSTIPAGPALASQLLSNAQPANPKYDIAQRVIDLGYLPGGATSLLAFAHQPQMVAPGWQYTYLKDLPGLQGFGQIILLTDRAETGRTWVEQVQPAIGKVPLFIVASAQAAPLLEPYVGSGQVAGMVRGVLGGAMYAQLAGQHGNAAVGALSAYQIGIGLAFILILAGGLVSGGAALLKRDRKDEE